MSGPFSSQGLYDPRHEHDACGLALVATLTGVGQSLIVWAIAEGRSAAAGVDVFLSGSTTLTTAIAPTERPLAI